MPAPRFFFFLLLVKRELDGPGMVRGVVLGKMQVRGLGGFMRFYAARAPFGAGDRIGAGETAT